MIIPWLLFFILFPSIYMGYVKDNQDEYCEYVVENKYWKYNSDDKEYYFNVYNNIDKNNETIKVNEKTWNETPLYSIFNKTTSSIVFDIFFISYFFITIWLFATTIDNFTKS
jgi:hypothetical protein